MPTAHLPMHVIRLRGPWYVSPLARTELATDGSSRTVASQLPTGGRVAVPGDWGSVLGNGFRGRALFTRNFHRPTGLTAESRVYLVVEEIDCWGEVSVNETFVDAIRGNESGHRMNITSVLELRNRLSILVECPRIAADCAPLPRPSGREGRPGGLTGEIRLEIEDERNAGDRSADSTDK